MGVPSTARLAVYCVRPGVTRAIPSPSAKLTACAHAHLCRRPPVDMSTLRPRTLAKTSASDCRSRTITTLGRVAVTSSIPTFGNGTISGKTGGGGGGDSIGGAVGVFIACIMCIWWVSRRGRQVERLFLSGAGGFYRVTRMIEAKRVPRCAFVCFLLVSQAKQAIVNVLTANTVYQRGKYCHPRPTLCCEDVSTVDRVNSPNKGAGVITIRGRR